MKGTKLVKTKILTFIFFLTVQFLIIDFSVAKPEHNDPGERFIQIGAASWYGPGFQGRKTASGEIFDTYSYTAAHRTLPFGTLLKVTNLSNSKFVVVKVNDRGPFARGRIIDLSKASKEKLEMGGLAQVKIEEISDEEAELLRSGIDPFDVVDNTYTDSSKFTAISLLDTQLSSDSKVILQFTSEDGVENDFQLNKNVMTSGNLKVKIITPKTNEDNQNSNLYKRIDNIDTLIRFYDLSNQLTVVNGYMIEVNTFNDKTFADRFIGRLERDGFKTVYLEEILSSDPDTKKQNAVYKVLVGLYYTEKSANNDMKELRKLKYQPSIVKIGD